jgi:hypothetical protein
MCLENFGTGPANKYQVTWIETGEKKNVGFKLRIKVPVNTTCSILFQGFILQLFVAAEMHFYE